ncbi:hypothetical protein XENOCAPTIV_017780 [Xenoophorus captivus]|uniref:Uncharacterized protein n=1 Tax=Xenoophorus captivus TaxID=1517983 RepID=A0ABV0RHV4_9TELE
MMLATLGVQEDCGHSRVGIESYSLYSLFWASAVSRQSRLVSVLSVGLSVDASFSFSSASLRFSEDKHINVMNQACNDKTTSII